VDAAAIKIQVVTKLRINFLYDFICDYNLLISTIAAVVGVVVCVAVVVSASYQIKIASVCMLRTFCLQANSDKTYDE
jgi:hypothetical protein